MCCTCVVHAVGVSRLRECFYTYEEKWFVDFVTSFCALSTLS